MPITQTAEGDTFLHTDLISSTYVQPDITPERAYRWFTENVHLRNNIVNLSAQVFQGPAEITVIDTDTDEIHPDLSEWMRSQCARLSLDTQMQAAWSDCMWAGAAVKSVGYGRRNGTYTVTEIRHLPAITFREAPPEFVSYNNPLIPGITYDTKRGEVRLFQAATGGFITRELQNFTIVRDPNTPFPGGLSYCLPVYPVVAAIDVANQAANQQVMRTGAPLIFPKFEQMNDSMKEWGKNFVRRWGKNVGFTIPPGVEFVDPQIHETDTAAVRLEMLIKWVDSYFNPTTVLDSEGTKIGSSDSGAMQIWYNYISGTQSWLEQQFEALLQPVLDANGYDGYAIDITLPRPTIDQSEQKRKQVLAAMKGKAITREEIRENLGDLKFADFTDEIARVLDDEYADAGGMSGFGAMNTTNAIKNVPREQEEIIRQTQKALEEADRKAYEQIYGSI